MEEEYRDVCMYHSNMPEICLYVDCPMYRVQLTLAEARFLYDVYGSDETELFFTRFFVDVSDTASVARGLFLLASIWKMGVSPMAEKDRLQMEIERLSSFGIKVPTDADVADSTCVWEEFEVPSRVGVPELTSFGGGSCLYHEIYDDCPLSCVLRNVYPQGSSESFFETTHSVFGEPDVVCGIFRLAGPRCQHVAEALLWECREWRNHMEKGGPLYTLALLYKKIRMMRLLEEQSRKPFRNPVHPAEKSELAQAAAELARTAGSARAAKAEEQEFARAGAERLLMAQAEEAWKQALTRAEEKWNQAWARESAERREMARAAESSRADAERQHLARAEEQWKVVRSRAEEEWKLVWAREIAERREFAQAAERARDEAGRQLLARVEEEWTKIWAADSAERKEWARAAERARADAERQQMARAEKEWNDVRARAEERWRQVTVQAVADWRQVFDAERQEWARERREWARERREWARERREWVAETEARGREAKNEESQPSYASEKRGVHKDTKLQELGGKTLEMTGNWILPWETEKKIQQKMFPIDTDDGVEVRHGGLGLRPLGKLQDGRSGFELELEVLNNKKILCSQEFCRYVLMELGLNFSELPLGMETEQNKKRGCFISPIEKDADGEMDEENLWFDAADEWA